MLRVVCFLLCAAVAFQSCSVFSAKEEEKGNPIARVYDKYLYESDVAGVGKGAAKPEDSVQAVKNYIDSWIRHNIILHYAQENLPKENPELEKQLQDYRESLIIYLYEKELIAQKLDTVVSENEIAEYYQQHKDNFELKTAVSKMRFVMLPKTSRVKTDSAFVWLKKPNEMNNSKLENFCEEHAIKFQVSDSVWYSQDEITALLPLTENNLENAPYSKSLQKMSDSAYNYLVSFDDFKLKGNDAPIQYVHDNIVNIILNKRKLAYLSEVHNTVYTNAQDNKKFETY